MEVLKRGISQLYSDYDLDGDNNDVIKENRAVKEALKNIGKTEVIKMILFCLELTRWDKKDDMGRLSFNYQVEHIMPQKWKEHWKLASNRSEDERNLAVKQIGNMILLSQKLNGHLQNSEYKIKMEGVHDGKKVKEGYRDRTQLKMTKEIIDQYNAGDQIWDEEHIEKRTNSIGEEVIKHWDVTKLLEEVRK